MALSVFDLFKIGIGPSSSHTVGPMKAALQFASELRERSLLERTANIRAALYGSLGATGKGHGSDKAVILGLEGESPESVDTERVDERLVRIRAAERIAVLGTHEIAFREKDHLIMHRRESLPYHSNGMRFTALAAEGTELHARVYYSVGGGFVVDESAAGANRIVLDTTQLRYPFKTGTELLEHCREH